MRARLAIQSSEIKVQLREIVLNNKEPDFLTSSAKGTVPVIVTHNEVIEESLDIMCWALNQADPEDWLKMPNESHYWISRNDGSFKTALDHTKYSTRYPNPDARLGRKEAVKFLRDLNTQISNNAWIFGANCSLADMAILPFVRQFANIDRHWFDSQGWQNLERWLTMFLASSRFSFIMTKYKKWVPGDPVVSFPSERMPKTISGATFHRSKS